MEKINNGNKVYCRYLKAKSPYGTLEGGNSNWFMMDNANTICWCVRTQGRSGPDNGLVDPIACVEGRACFVKPE